MAAVVAGRRRSGGRKNPLFVAGHVDHIITVQGADTEVSTKYKNGLSPVTEHVVNGIIHSTMEGLKSNMKINLPIISDDTSEDQDEGEELEAKKTPQKNGYQPVNVYSSREIIDLSPIYENSSDACSSHDDLRESTNEIDVLKSSKMTNGETNDSSSATPNSLSQTHSENSIELSGHTDSIKNSSKRKKRVNIVHDISVDTDITDTEITALRVDSQSSLSPDCSTADSKDGYLTMTGTIKRGKKKGQNVDVKLNISREELEIIEAAIVAEEYNKMDISKCSLHNGPHVFIFTLLTIPFVACMSALYSFYVGTITWYNIFTSVTEETNFWKRISLSPIVILLYPFLIVAFTFGLGLYAGIVQLTFSGSNWWKEVCDFEKGFYGWLCNSLGVSECSPYEVVVLTDIKGT